MSCIGVPEIFMDEWANNMLAPLGKQRYPLSASIELTERCNLNCVHCYIDQPANSQAARAREMSTEEVKLVLDQMAKAGTLYLLLTGGEVLLRSDFAEIYLHAKRLGFIITVFTNGTLVSEEVAELLAKAPPYMVELTLLGGSAETFEAITQVPGSFERCLRGINLLKQYGLEVNVKTVMLTLNQHELIKIEDLAESLGVPHRYDSTIWPRLDGSHSPYDYRLSAEDTLKMDLNDSERIAEWSKAAEKYAGIPVRGELAFTCGAAVRSYHVDSAGRMCACMMARRPSYSLLEMPFAEAWEKLGEIRSIKRTNKTECESCIANDLCNQCPGWSQLTYQNYETQDEFVCKLGKLRTQYFGKIVHEPICEGVYE